LTGREKSIIFAGVNFRIFKTMAIPIRSIPVLEGAVWRRFERERIKSEKRRGTIDISKDMEIYRAIVLKARTKGTLK
jgi:hypothetical protein